MSLLSQLISAAAGAGDEVVYSWRSFEAYPGLVTVAGRDERPGAEPRRRHATTWMRWPTAITERTRVVIVCTPEQPDRHDRHGRRVRRLHGAVPSDLLVLLDEAYYEFVTDDDAVDGIPLLGRYPNLVVLRTFSKAYGLAALRIGYAVGPGGRPGRRALGRHPAVGHRRSRASPRSPRSTPRTS